MYIDITYIILVLPAILLTLYAQAKVKSTFNKYLRVSTKGCYRSRSGKSHSSKSRHT